MEMSREESHYHEDTELRLALPGSNKRKCSTINESTSGSEFDEITPKTKVQVIGWPPVRTYRKNCLQEMKSQKEVSSTFVKVSMDGAPYLRKVDLKLYKDYSELLKALEDMFKLKSGKLSNKETQSNELDYKPTYEDKDGDWMLVGDVPWEMFVNSCKKLRIVKGSVINLACLA